MINHTEMKDTMDRMGTITSKIACHWVFFGVFFLIFMGWISTPNAQVEKDSNLKLRESYHELNTSYQVSEIRPLSGGSKQFQTVMMDGRFAMTPVFSVGAKLPLVTLDRQVGLTNPYLGVEAVIFDGLVKDFPTFAYLRGGVKLPMKSDREFIFDRTDVILNFSTLREVQHLSLLTDTSYIIKVDPSPQTKSYGNEWLTSVGGKMDTGYHFSSGFFLNYRRSGQFKTISQNISGRSLLILKPMVAYNYDLNTTLIAAFSSPLTRVNLRDTLMAFGDYTIGGISGNSLFFSLEKKF